MARVKSCVRALLIPGFALGLGLVCLWQYHSSPFWKVPIIDEAGYVQWAEEIASGNFLGDRAFYQDPLYPYLLAALFALFGKSLLAVRLLQTAMAFGSVYLVYWTGQRLGGGRQGLSAALALSLYGGMYFFALLILKASLSLFLSALVCAAGVWASERPELSRRWLLTGVALGLLTLLRGNLLLVLPVLLIWSFFASIEKRSWSGLARPLLLACGAALVLFPVSFRNYAVSGEFVLTTTQGGSNFYIGNNPEADGRYVILGFIRANPAHQAEDFRQAAERRTGRAMSSEDASRFWLREGLEWIRENPEDAARLWLRKLRLALHQYEVPDNQSYYLIRKEFVSALWAPIIGFGVLSGPALVGLVIMWRRERRSRFVAVFTLAYLFSLLPFFIVSRYRLPLAPGLALFFGYAWIWAGEAVRSRKWRSCAIAGTAAATIWLSGLWPIAPPEGVVSYGYYILANAYLETGRPRAALEWCDRALEGREDEEMMAGWFRSVSSLGTEDAELLLAESRRPDRGVEELDAIAQRLMELGLDEEAVAVYERALVLDPDDLMARLRLALLYAERTGGCDAAGAERHLSHALSLRPDLEQRSEYAAAAKAIEDCRGRE